MTSAAGRAAVLAADRGEEAAIGRERHVLHAGRMPAQGDELRAGGDIPDLDLAVLAGGGET